MSSKFRFRFPVLISLFASVLVPSNVLPESAKARSTISITKLHVLKVGYMSNDSLLPVRHGNPAQLSICLDTAGQALPFRLTAETRGTSSDHSADMVVESSELSYHVYWSNGRHRHRLFPHLSIMSPVLKANSGRGCDLRTLSVEGTNSRRVNMSSQNVETLILTFVIE